MCRQDIVIHSDIVAIREVRHTVTQGLVPPTCNFTSPGDGCDLDYVPNQPRVMDTGIALNNSFAFGGLNSVLLVRRC